MNDAVSRIMGSVAARAFIALALVAYLIANALAANPYQARADFYQFWGITRVVDARAQASLSSPYADPASYGKALDEITAASGSERLRAANALRPRVEPTGTPLFYALFNGFPNDYDLAQGIFATLIYLAGGLGVFILARRRGLTAWDSVSISALVELTFIPFMVDVKVGNVNSLQFLLVAILVAVADRRREERERVAGVTFLAILAFLVTFKPNIAWIALGLAIHHGTVVGQSRFLAATAAAAVFSLCTIAAGAWYFHDAAVWGEWLRYLGEMGGIALPLTLEQGNQSLTMLLARRSMSYGTTGYAIIVAVFLVLALATILSASGRRADLLGPAATKVFSDPWFAASLGVVFTFATSPLLWTHYLVFALIPILWLLRGHGPIGTWSAVIVYCLMTWPVIDLLIAARLRGVMQVITFASWMLLIPGIFVWAIEQRRKLAATEGASA